MDYLFCNLTELIFFPPSHPTNVLLEMWSLLLINQSHGRYNSNNKQTT